MPKLVTLKVIVSDECRGKGIEGDPIYRVFQMFTTDGKLICEAGPFMGDRLKQTMYADYDFISGLKMEWPACVGCGEQYAPGVQCDLCS